MPRLKLHQIALALAVSAALTACGEKTAQKPKPLKQLLPRALPMLPQAPPLFRPLKILPMFLPKTKPCWNAHKPCSNLCLMRPKCKKSVRLPKNRSNSANNFGTKPACPKATLSAVTLATTWQRPAWTTCRPARATKANSAPVTPQLP